MNAIGKAQEECAVFGVSLKTKDASSITYNGLLSLQHRGQEGSGIAFLNENCIFCHKNSGLVSEVFSKKDFAAFPKSGTAIGHNRYSTTGSNSLANVQPFVTEYLSGRIATAHNGNITNAKEIKTSLEEKGIAFHATSDSEVISSLIASCIVASKSSLLGVIKAASLLKGAFTLLVLCSDGYLIAIRDPNGYRPLCVGSNQDGFCIASESCAFYSCGFQFLYDVLPGEVLVFKNGNLLHRSIALEKKEDGGLCIFEYVYFARPDSIIDHLSVYEARYNMGQILAKEHPIDADIVCGVPDSGLEAANGYSVKSGIPFVPAFVKNRYIGRSFICPTQSQRENAAFLKLTPLPINVRGKKIILVDDSIVRGTTSKRIIDSLRSAGALEIHLLISSPPFRFSCQYGTDIDCEENLIANQMSLSEIEKEIGVDSLSYISMAGLLEACKKANLPFCTKCFTGNSSAQRKNELEV